MPRGLNAEEVGKWIQRLRAAQHWFSDELASSDEIVQHYQRRQGLWTDSLGAAAGLRRGRRFSANYVWANMQVLMPSVYAGTPRVLVKPRDETQGASARSQEKWFNWLLPQIGWRAKRRSAVRSAFLRGFGVNKFGWKSAEPSESPTEPRGGLETVPAGAAWIEYLSPFNFLADPEYFPDLDKCRWVAHRVMRPVEELRRDRTYRNTEKIKGARHSSTFADYYRSRKISIPSEFEDQDLAEVFEIWARDIAGLERRILTISPEADEYFRFGDWPLGAGVESVPFDLIHFHGSEDEGDGAPAMPIPECRAWMSLQKALNLLLSKAISHIDRFDRVGAYNTSYIPSGEELESAVLGGDGKYVAVNNVDDIRKAVMFFDWGQLPPEYFAAFNLVRSALQEVSGVGELQRGSAPATLSATGASIQQANASMRAQDRRAILVECDRRALRLVKQIAQENITEEFLIPVAGPAGRDWIPVSPEDIRAELDVEVELDSIAPETLEARKQREMMALQTVGPLLNSPNGVPAGVRELLRRFLRSNGFEDEELFLPPLAGGIPSQEHVAWLLDEVPAPEVRPEDDDASHIAAHSGFLEKYGARLGEQDVAVIEDHIARHRSQMAEKRASGGISVRGGLRPIAPAAGTPGALTGSPGLSEASLEAPAEIGA